MKLLFAILIFSVAISEAFGIKCYECSGEKDNCHTTRNNCASVFNKCLKITKGDKSVIKECANDATCANMVRSCKQKGNNCTVDCCGDEDFCNAGAASKPVVFLTIIVMFLAYFM